MEFTLGHNELLCSQTDYMGVPLIWKTVNKNCFCRFIFFLMTFFATILFILKGDEKFDFKWQDPISTN